tara:strand:- start:26402 stop:26953 length:552 start_codon:yes stop_codon:yes gene_type:complete
MNGYSKYFSLKSSIEGLLGTEAWYALKESQDISTWKKFLGKALKALKVSILETVQVCDDEWRAEISTLIDDGVKHINRGKSIDELISSLAATSLNVAFLQTGFLPRRESAVNSVSLRKANWRHDLYRQVVYLQTPKQKESLFWHKQQRKMGVQAQIEHYGVYRRSGSRLPYSEWCQTGESRDQ